MGDRFLLTYIMQIEEHVPLASLTTFGIGGEARYFVRVRTVEGLRESLDFLRPGSGQGAQNKNAPVYILGGGSNTLVPDSGFEGLVIKIEIAGIEIQEERYKKGEDSVSNAKTETEENKTLVVVGAGESWDGLVQYAVEHGLWGLENLSGIPGTVGGAAWGNIGAYGASASQSVAWVEAYDRVQRELVRLDASLCAFGYRDSFFKQRASRYIITRVAFALSRVAQPNLVYKDLALRFATAQQSKITEQKTTSEVEVTIEQETEPTLANIRDAVLAIRREKFPDLAIEGTAGSFFKNPIVSKEVAAALVAKYPHMPTFALPEAAGVKIPLAWLLDQVLQLRGFSVGGARLFEHQPLVLVASRGASSADVRTLASEVQQKVSDAFGIRLEKEVQEMR